MVIVGLLLGVICLWHFRFVITHVKLASGLFCIARSTAASPLTCMVPARYIPNAMNLGKSEAHQVQTCVAQALQPIGQCCRTTVPHRLPLLGVVLGCHGI